MSRRCVSWLPKFRAFAKESKTSKTCAIFPPPSMLLMAFLAALPDDAGGGRFAAFYSGAKRFGAAGSRNRRGACGCAEGIPGELAPQPFERI